VIDGLNVPQVAALPSPRFFTELLDEPQLLFAGNHPGTDPKVGLAAAGPADLETPNHPKQIPIGIIGTGATRERAIDWVQLCGREIAGKKDKPRQVPPFPGFNSSSPFKSEFQVADSPLGIITSTELQNILRQTDYEDGFRAAVSLISGKIQLMVEESPAIKVLLCALPTEIVEYCLAAGRQLRSEGMNSKPDRLFAKLARIEESTGQQNMLSSLFEAGAGYTDFVGRNLRRALKAQSMRWQRPLQLAREDSLLSAGRSQHAATKAWNFCTAMYYKAGALPWKLEGLDPDSCFVGVSFYRHINEQSFEMHTSLAQVFTGYGDAFVLRGHKFSWPYDRRSPHLSQEGARNLVLLVRQKYDEWKKRPPSRIIVHKTSKFYEDELAGFKEGLAGISQYDLLSIQQTGVRLFREGAYPPLRRTFFEVNEQASFLYTNGYLPELGTYPRGYVPEPFELIDHHGDSTPRRLSKEILALTKMNYNNADIADGEPITIKFARKVGEIMSYMSEGEPERHYRFYM